MLFTLQERHDSLYNSKGQVLRYTHYSARGTEFTSFMADDQQMRLELPVGKNPWKLCCKIKYKYSRDGELKQSRLIICKNLTVLS